MEAGQSEGNSGGRIENPGGQRGFAAPDDTEAVEVGEQQLDVIGAEGYPPEHLPRQTHDGDSVAEAVPECDGEEGLRVAGLVHRGEVRVVGEGAPGPADGAEATEIFGREAQQDFEQSIGGQCRRRAGVGQRGGVAQLRAGRHRSGAVRDWRRRRSEGGAAGRQRSAGEWLSVTGPVV